MRPMALVHRSRAASIDRPWSSRIRPQLSKPVRISKVTRINEAAACGNVDSSFPVHQRQTRAHCGTNALDPNCQLFRGTLSYRKSARPRQRQPLLADGGSRLDLRLDPGVQVGMRIFGTAACAMACSRAALGSRKAKSEKVRKALEDRSRGTARPLCNLLRRGWLSIFTQKVQVSVYERLPGLHTPSDGASLRGCLGSD